MVNRAAALIAAYSVLTVQPSIAEVSDERRAEESRWTPSFALVTGVYVQGQQAQIVSDLVATHPLAEFRPPAEGSTVAVTPYFGGQLELMAPALPRVPGNLRFFISGELLGQFATRREVASEGNADDFFVPENAPPDNVPNGATAGFGSRASSQYQTLTWAAFAGISFSFEAWGRLLRLKPGAGWTNFAIDYSGLTNDTFKVDPQWPGGTIPYPPNFGEYIRFISLSAATTEVYNAIGPGLELEMEVGEWGPVRPSLFLMFYGFKVLGDRNVVLSDTETYADPYGVGTYTSTWRWTLDPWMYRAGAGFRFRWMGMK